MRGMKAGELVALGATIMGFVTIMERFVPDQVWNYTTRRARNLMSWASWETAIVVDEIAGRYDVNKVYQLVELYITFLLSDTSKNSAESVYFSQVKNSTKPSYNLGAGETISDVFEGVTFQWEFRTVPTENRGDYFRRGPETQKTYKVTSHKRYKNTVLPRYMDYVVSKGKELQHETRERFLYTNIRGQHSHFHNRPWNQVTFNHPATFQTLALAPSMKETILNDLDSFMRGEEFYKRVGRAWKRGYLLFGPPGTGKSSLIAAIANYTQYDVYDLELTEVNSNANLRELLMAIGNKAIIVIEDIDCSLELKKRGKPAPETDDEEGKENKQENIARPGGPNSNESSRVTLSGLLNFIDGLWSGIENERIIIFTTNYKELLDPALLRAGRMDMHILMSYCCFEAFKCLAWTYLKIKEHGLFDRVEQLIAQADITPAEVAEILIQHKGDVDVAIEKVLEALIEPNRKKDLESVQKGGCEIEAESESKE